MKFWKYFFCFSYIFILVTIFSGGLFIASNTYSLRIKASKEGDRVLSEGVVGKPNIIFILTDDLDSKLMDYMPKVKSNITDQGINFSNFFINVALCCPSRTAILKGQYAHNTKIFQNSGKYGGFQLFHDNGCEDSTVNVALQNLGYKTALIGKYLNGYPGSLGEGYIPPGWTEWDSPITDAAYNSFNYQVNENGTIVKYGNAPQDYITDVISNKAQKFIDQSVLQNSPFFLFISVYAPHAGLGASAPIPAPRHLNLFSDITLLTSKPSFNEEDVSDKPSFIKQLAKVEDWKIRLQLVPLYQNRIRSLQSVDEMVEAVIKKLEQSGIIDNTYIFFVSDNGFHIGEHRMTRGKNSAYEEDIRVPLIVRGPNIGKNTVNSEIVGNIDLAPSFLHLANFGSGSSSWTIGEEFDGRSIVPLLFGTNKTLFRRYYLLENTRFLGKAGSLSTDSEIQTTSDSDDIDDVLGLSVEKDADIMGDILGESDTVVTSTATPSGIPAFAGLRTPLFTYIEYSNGEKEFYNLTLDPFQLKNVAVKDGAAYVQETIPKFSEILHQMMVCKGTSCRATDGGIK